MSSPRPQHFRGMSKYPLSMMERAKSLPLLHLLRARILKGTPFHRWEHEAHSCKRPLPRSSKKD